MFLFNLWSDWCKSQEIFQNITTYAENYWVFAALIEGLNASGNSLLILDYKQQSMKGISLKYFDNCLKTFIDLILIANSVSLKSGW